MNMYSEEELVHTGVPWGEWKFSLSNDQIKEKLASLPRHHDDEDKHCGNWPKLFSLLQNKPNLEASDSDFNKSLLPAEVSAMECSLVSNTYEEGATRSNVTIGSSIEDICICLVELCNQEAPKLKNGLENVQEEMKNVTSDLKKLNESLLILVMDNVWPQLHSDASKLCFCLPFFSNSEMCQKLCTHVLLPWLSKSPPSKMEQLSAILSAEGEIICHHLIAPLLRSEGSSLVQDTLTLEELMSCMKKKHWTTLLRVILSGLEEFQKWQIPVLVTIVQHSEPTQDDLHLLYLLMSSTGSAFAQSRDFGALLVAIASCLEPGPGQFGTQLKLLTNNYKGPLKFKILKILADKE